MNQPSFNNEQEYWQQGIRLIAGLDEAGMGAWAGPVVAAAVVFEPEHQVSSKLIRDSKKLSPKQREAARKDVDAEVLAWGVGEASIEEITKFNIREASHLAMRRAIGALHVKVELLLLDGTPAQIHDQIPTVNIIDGDAVSYSIAAASIIAKTHRDHVMQELNLAFPGYGFGQHKGYGSAAHQAALEQLGVCACHRPTYGPIKAIIDRKARVLQYRRHH